MSETETIVLKDGTRVKLPQGLSDEEIENALAAAMPARMASFQSHQFGCGHGGTGKF